MTSSVPESAAPLTEAEFDQISEWLALGSPFDIHGLLGITHAVAVAPSMLEPSEWMPLLTPECGELPMEQVQSILELIFRLQLSVMDALSSDPWMVPEPDDVKDCASFAAGFVAAAELDPEWLGDEARWALTAPFAYLADRHDLLSDETIAHIERAAAPGDPQASIRQRLAELVASINDAFREVRSTLAVAAARDAVGRRD